MANRSTTHLVLIPSYNPGPKVYATVRAALAQWDARLGRRRRQYRRFRSNVCRRWRPTEPALRVFVLPENRGKGAAVLHGLREAAARGFTHALTMDSDGQHPADRIAEFMRISQAASSAMVLGRPDLRLERTERARQRPEDLQLVGSSRNAVGRHRRLAVTAFVSIRSPPSSA